MFEDSFDASIKYDQQSFAQVKAGSLKMPNRDLDTGQRVSPGEYLLTDRTYDKLLIKLSEKKFAGVTAAVREDILRFYAQMKAPDQHGIEQELSALQAFTPPVN
jgi:hypothetical protein